MPAIAMNFFMRASLVVVVEPLGSTTKVASPASPPLDPNGPISAVPHCRLLRVAIAGLAQREARRGIEHIAGRTPLACLERSHASGIQASPAEAGLSI
jgi:hypothetical protein